MTNPPGYKHMFVYLFIAKHYGGRLLNACSTISNLPNSMPISGQANKSFFSEIIASISDITFSKDGRFILSRDYMTLKLWDLNKESSPVATYNVHEHLRARVSETELGIFISKGSETELSICIQL